MQRNSKKLRNIELRNDMRTEKKKDAMEINRTATELATSMTIEKPPPSASQEAPMEEGELVNSSSTSSDDDNEPSRNSIPVAETTANGLGGAKAIKTHIPPMHHTVRDISLSRRQI
jgi:hypothetical protein